MLFFSLKIWFIFYWIWWEKKEFTIFLKLLNCQHTLNSATSNSFNILHFKRETWLFLIIYVFLQLDFFLKVVFKFHSRKRAGSVNSTLPNLYLSHPIHTEKQTSPSSWLPILTSHYQPSSLFSPNVVENEILILLFLLTSPILSQRSLMASSIPTRAHPLSVSVEEISFLDLSLEHLRFRLDRSLLWVEKEHWMLKLMLFFPSPILFLTVFVPSDISLKLGGLK